jgi:hypothetical protein
MGSVHARGDTFLTFGLKALTETNTSRLATGIYVKNGFHSLKRHATDPFLVTEVKREGFKYRQSLQENIKKEQRQISSLTKRNSLRCNKIFLL